MKKLILITTAAAFTLASGAVFAATLKNTDKGIATVSVDIGGKAQTIKLKPGATYNTRGKEATFAIGADKLAAKGNDKLVIKNGKIEAEVAAAAPAAGKPTTKKEAK